MPVGAFTVYSEAIEAQATGSLGSLTAGPMYAVLLTNSYSPNVELHATRADISAAETAGAAKIALAGLTVTDITGGYRFNTSNITWGTNVTINASKYLVLLFGTAASPQSTDKLLGYVDLDNATGTATVSATNGEFTVNCPGSGWFSSTRQ
jgi:hypothetical protein